MTGTYEEDGWIAHVEVVEDNCDKGWESYEFKVLKTLQESPIYMPPDDGSVFAARHNTAYSSYRFWTFTPDEEENGA